MSSHWGIITEHGVDLTSCQLRSSQLMILAGYTVPLAVREQDISITTTFQPGRRRSYRARRLDLVIRIPAVFTP